MPSDRPGEPGRGGTDLVPAPPAAPVLEPAVEKLERCGGFGVDDGVHVIGPADRAQHRHRLVR